jgi:hypothetical protein
MSTVLLEIFVEDITTTLLSFDVLRVKRSIDGEEGDYDELTGPAATAAQLTSTNESIYSGLVGKTLILEVDHEPQETIIFTGLSDLTATEAANQINDVIAGIATETANKLRLTSTTLGAGSKIKIVGGTATSILGFTVNQFSIGLVPYLELEAGQTDYIFVDEDGESSYWYSVAYFNSVTEVSSDFSSPFQASGATVLDSDDLSTASIDLVDLSGVPVVDQKISFFPQQKPLSVGSYQVGLNRAPVTVKTDVAGHASVSLVRGASIRVVFHGTSLIKDIIVPDAASFDLLDLIEGAPDIYEVVKLNLPAAPRRSI